MTENTQTKYTTPGSHNLHIPSRAEFHRYFPNNITVADFDTDHCKEGAQARKVENAINKTYSWEQDRKSKLWRFAK